MSKRVLAIVGSYRKGGIVDTAVDAVLEGAREKGAETAKIYLLDEHIEFCRNCRSCTQEPSDSFGKCVIDDDQANIIREVQNADALVLGSPVNCWNVTALFRRFLERLIVCAYWPWGQPAPRFRIEEPNKAAVLVSSCAAPAFLLPIATGAARALKNAARALGAVPVGKLWIGMIAQQPEQRIPAHILRRARQLGHRLA